MKNLGDFIKTTRIKNGLTQHQLSKNICTQSTISNIENGITMPNFITLELLAERLKIRLDEFYITDEAAITNELFIDVNRLIELNQHKKGYYLLREKSIEIDLTSIQEKKLFYYYLGITELIGFFRYDEAEKNFNLVLNMKLEQDFINVLTFCGLGISSYMQNNLKMAMSYFDVTINQAKDFSDLKELAKVYYNSAKFYSSQNDCYKAINLCERGILVITNLDIKYHASYLYYELANNLARIGNFEDAALNYFYASSYAIESNIMTVKKAIIEDIKEFNLEQLDYINKLEQDI